MNATTFASTMRLVPRRVPTMAVVHAADGVRFVATETGPDALFAQLAEYVRTRCDDVLWPDAAGRVHTLLGSGNLRAAIALYFDRTGERWDEERLELLTVEDGAYRVPDEERMSDARR
ncbi:MAG: hypothetical protein ACYC3L_14890 [Gemmatimonadaceae bacterium]